MPEPVLISIVVCTFNRCDMVKEAIASLFHLETEGLFTYEIVVVDDASTDGTCSVLKSLSRIAPVPLRVVKGAGSGVAAARNTGVVASNGNYIAFFDDDQYADVRWLTELYRVVQETGAACVGGSRSLALPTEEVTAIPYIIRLYLGEIGNLQGPYLCSRSDLLCTGTVLMKSDLFDQVGLFDENLTQGGEDTEFFIRVRSAGLQCWYTPRAHVRHMVPEYRRQAPYLMWAAKRGGSCFAWRDAQEYGRFTAFVLGLVRVAHSTVVHVPLLMLSVVQGRASMKLARKCQVYRAWSYCRTATDMFFGRNRGTSGAPNKIDFRSERSLFVSSSR